MGKPVLVGVMVAGLTAAGPALAAVTDPVGDFLDSYTGPQTPDLDVVAADFRFDGESYRIAGTMAGPIDTASTALYVFGIDRGAGTELLSDIVAGVPFDAVVGVGANGTGFVTDISAGTTSPLAGGDVTISGSTFIAVVAADLLPSTGFAPLAYTGNLWPRSEPDILDNAVVSDFAPDASNFVVTPAPAALPLLATAIGGLGLLAHGRRRVSTC
jgi:hypothetical protein